MITRNVVTLDGLYQSLPPDIAKDKFNELTQAYERVIDMLKRYTPEDGPDVNIRVDFYAFSHCGEQYIAEGAVYDLSKPVKNEYNWHLQNTSQWLFAFGLLFSRGEFSIHT